MILTARTRIVKIVALMFGEEIKKKMQSHEIFQQITHTDDPTCFSTTLTSSCFVLSS